MTNKANLRDLIAATGLVILLKLDSSHPLFSMCNLEIWWMTPGKQQGTSSIAHKPLCIITNQLVKSNWQLQSGNAQFGSKSAIYLSHVTLKFDGWPRKTIGYLIYAASSFLHNFIPINELKLELQSGNAQFGSKSAICCPVWPWNLTDDLDKQ